MVSRFAIVLTPSTTMSTVIRIPVAFLRVILGPGIVIRNSILYDESPLLMI